MQMAERIFRLISLICLGIGLILGVASAEKKHGAKDAIFAAQEILNDVQDIEEINRMNLNMVDNYPYTRETD